MRRFPDQEAFILANSQSASFLFVSSVRLACLVLFLAINSRQPWRRYQLQDKLTPMPLFARAK